MNTILRTLIRFYQLAISPWLGVNCRFYPSCSCYCKQAIKEHGNVKGLWLGVKRVLRCHPFSTPGIDPVPTSPKKNM